MQQAITWANVDLYPWHHMTSLGNELIRANKVNDMSANALDPCIVRSLPGANELINCGLIENFVNTGSGNSLLPDGTKPLQQLMLTNHQCVIHLRAISQVMLNIYLFPIWVWKWLI